MRRKTSVCLPAPLLPGWSSIWATGAVGVEYQSDGQTCIVYAREVVPCAGAVNSLSC